MTVSWTLRAAQADELARHFREVANRLPMRTHDRKKAFATAQRFERDAVEYRRKEPKP